MASGIFSAFSSYGWIASMGRWIVIFFVLLFVALILTALTIWLVVILKTKKAIEISQINKKIKTFGFRTKKSKKGLVLGWLSKYRKFVPYFEEKDFYSKGRKDYVFLLKDNNGLHHTLRIPNYSELKIWYNKVYNLDVEKIAKTPIEQLNDNELKVKNGLGTIFLLPNPSEDLDWLAGQLVEVKKEFQTSWWNSPVVMVLGTVGLCVFLFIINIILIKKL